MLAKKVVIIRTLLSLVYFKREGKREPDTVNVIDCKNKCKVKELCESNDLSTICIYIIHRMYYNNYFPCYIKRNS